MVRDSIACRYCLPIAALLKRRHVLWPVLIVYTVVVLWIDFITGPSILFPAWMILPVLVAAWSEGYIAGFAFAFTLPLLRLGMKFIWNEVPWPMSHSLANFVLRVTALMVIAALAAQLGRLTRTVKMLEGLLPICMYCHKIRNADNEWERLEPFLAARSNASFSHGLCPTCETRQTR
jgi:hypothetical protein